ncbi:MAG TPA: AMP-dependent synthetase [Syntrophus sp. (in: bacteria)]|nr:AMP-dependent synthetase [Syntrophus sp. (in: bacteria)]
MRDAVQTSQNLAINTLKKHRDRIFTDREGLTLRYGDIEVASNRVANGILACGYGPGDHIAVVLPNGADYAVADFGIYKSGAALVPMNMMLSPADVAFILKDSGARMAFVDASLAAKVQSMQCDLPQLKEVVVVGGATGDELIGWEDFKAKYPDSVVAPTAAEDDDGLIVYTGGTTGKPKGVVHSQKSLFFDILAHVVELPFVPDDKLLIVTPMSHATGWLLFAGCVRGTSFFIEASFDLMRILDIIEKEKITMTMMVPTIIYVFLDIIKTKPCDLSSLRVIGYGAAPISEKRLAEALEVFGPIFYQKYGLVECPNMITTLSVADHIKALKNPAILQSCGRPDVMVSLKIVDEEGREVPTGQVGEILVKAPYVMNRYLNQPDLTAETLKDGWLCTGDMGRVDEEGYVYILDRKKDMIISGGMNVFPVEVEELIRKHPRVKEVSVIGIPDDYWGEAVTACVVPDGEVTEDEIKAFCKGKLAKYAQPKNVVFQDALPKTLIGKIDKKGLREPFWEGKARRV